jgi:hypothetical protein
VRGGVVRRDVEILGGEPGAVGALDLDAVVAQGDGDAVGDVADGAAVDEDAGAEEIFADDLEVAGGGRAGVGRRRERG